MNTQPVEERRKRGRPVGSGGKITYEAIDRICAGVRLGMSYKSAALQANVTSTTFHNWMDKGKKNVSGIYVDFLIQMTKAIEDCKAFHLNNLHICAKGEEYTETTEKIDPKTNAVIERTTAKKRTKRDSSCSKWILERRFPDEFGARLELAGEMVTEVHIVPADEEETAFIDAMNSNIMDAPEDNS